MLSDDQGADCVWSTSDFGYCRFTSIQGEIHVQMQISVLMRWLFDDILLHDA